MSNTNTSPNELFSEEEIAQLKETGQPLSKTLSAKDGKVTTRPALNVLNNDSLPGTTGGWGGQAPRVTAPGQGQLISRPSKINDAQGNPVKIGLVSAPNPDRYNVIEDKRLAAERKAAEAARNELAEMSPTALHSTVKYLTRRLAKLERQLAKEGDSNVDS